MSERAPYSRVYWSIIDDEKFDTIFDDDHHLAAWLRLLLIADQAHPASAHLPAGVRRSSVKALVDAGLVDLAGSRYRIHGLDAERERRRVAATTRVGRKDHAGTVRGPNGDRSGTGSHPNGFATQGLRRDEQSKDEQDARASDDPWADPEHEALVWLARHGCDVRPGNGYHRKLVTAVEVHGVNALIGMFDRLAAAGTTHGDTKGFLFGAIDALDARGRPNLRALEKEERADEEAAARRQRFIATKVRAHESGSHVEPNDGCPSCETTAVRGR